MDAINEALEALLNMIPGDMLDEAANHAQVIKDAFSAAGDSGGGGGVTQEEYDALKAQYIARFFGRTTDEENVEVDTSAEDAAEDAEEEDDVKKITFSR